MRNVRVTMSDGWERKLKEAVAPQLEERAREMEAVLATFGAEHQAKSPEEIRPLLVDAFHSHGWKISDPELTNFAEAISDGTRITVRVKAG